MIYDKTPGMVPDGAPPRPAPAPASSRYPATPGMREDAPAAWPPVAPAPNRYPATPGMRNDTTSAPAQPAPRAERFPNTPGMKSDTAPPPTPEAAGDKPEPVEAKPGEAVPQDPAVAAYEVELPPGYEPDPTQFAEFKTLAVKHKLAPEVAAELIGLHRQALQAEDAALEEAKRGWADQAKRLPEWSSPDRAGALAATWGLADQATRRFLDESGLSNHPQLVRWSIAVGKELLRLRGGAPLPPAEAAARRYANTPGMRD